MKIACISYYLPGASQMGPGYQAHYLANALVSRGHQVIMFSPCPRPEGASYEHRRVHVRPPLRSLRFALALRRLSWGEFDAVHAHGEDFLLRLRGRPVHIRTMHGSCFVESLHAQGLRNRLRMVWLGLGEVLATIVADRTVCISENTRRAFPWCKTVIPCGVDTDIFRPGGSKSAQPSILFVGVLDSRKRGRLLLDVFLREVRPAIPEAELWIVRDDSPVQAPGVRCFGPVDVDTLAELYRKAWIFCLPSTYEGFGVPYVEAMASGTPVVATPNPGAREVTRDGADGVLVGDKLLGRTLVELLLDAAQREVLTWRGLERARDFSWERVCQQYEEVYARGVR